MSLIQCMYMAMPLLQQTRSNVSNNPTNDFVPPEKNEPRAKRAAKFIHRIRRAPGTFFSSQYHHHWWLCISVLTPLVYTALFIAAYCETLPKRLQKADVNVYWTYNCSAYANSTSPFQEWTSTCEAGPIANPVREQELLSAGKKCSVEMTADVPVSGELGRFSVECVRQEGFETKTTEFSFGGTLFGIALFGGLGYLFYYLWLYDAYSRVREVVSGAVSHLESCSSCSSLDATFSSSDHLPLVQFQLIKDSVRNQLILQAVLAPLFACLFVVTPSVALLLGSNWPITLLPCLLMWSHSLVGFKSFHCLGRKAFTLILTKYSIGILHGAAAIKAHYEEECSKHSFCYP